MIKSMTGFASVSREDERASIGVTIRAVNHRYLDLQIRLPQVVSEIESRLRVLMQSRIARGRLEVSVAVQFRQRPAVDVEVNQDFVAAIGAALDGLREIGLLIGPLTPGDLLRFPQAIAVREKPVEADVAVLDQIGQAIEDTVAQSLEELDAMRSREGSFLATDLERHRAAVGDLVERIAEAAVEAQTDLQARLAERVRELTVELQLDRAAIAQEIIRVASRSDISEEVVRFRAHLAQWAGLVEGPEPCGRKLDFLLQEMNREVNTMGAKADGPRVPELIVNAKAVLEKMREQVQNVE
jgi:uncharacterized protein (TIGR00255 family)